MVVFIIQWDSSACSDLIFVLKIIAFFINRGGAINIKYSVVIFLSSAFREMYAIGVLVPF